MVFFGLSLYFCSYSVIRYFNGIILLTVFDKAVLGVKQSARRLFLHMMLILCIYLILTNHVPKQCKGVRIYGNLMLCVCVWGGGA